MSGTDSIRATDSRERVLESRPPVVVDLRAEWCGPYHTLAPIMNRLAAEHAGRLAFTMINVDAEPALAERYGVEGISTVILFDHSQETGLWFGYANRSEFKVRLDRVLAAAAQPFIPQARIPASGGGHDDRI